MTALRRTTPSLARPAAVAADALPHLNHPLVLLAALSLRPLPPNWVQAWGVDDEEVDTLLLNHVLIEREDGLAPADETIREQTVQQARWSQRRQAHLLLAAACQRPSARFEAAAYHFEQAGQTDDAARAYLAAAEAHCRRHRHAAARRCFFAGLRLLPPSFPEAEVVRALQNLGRCAALAAEIGDAVHELRSWAAQPVWNERLAVRIETQLQLAALLARDGRPVESAQARHAAARDLAASGRDEEAVTAAIAAAGALAYAAQVTLAREAAEAAVNAADRIAHPALQAEALTWRALIIGMLGETAAAQADLNRAMDLALKHQLTGAAAEAQRLLGTVYEFASHYEDEQAAFAKALNYCQRHGESFTAGICLGCLSYSYLRSGNWRRCEETARRVVRDRKIPKPSRYVAGSVLGLLHAYRGETRPALRLLRDGLQRCRSIGLLVMDFFNLTGLALVAEANGEPEEAGRRYVELLEFWRSGDDRHDAIPGLTFATTFFAEHGRADDAAASAEALARIASLTSNAEAAGAAAAAAGELFLLDGAPAKAVSRFRQALVHYDQRKLSVEPVLVRIRLGAALRQAGDGREGDRWLAEARQQARRLGARPLAARAEALLSQQTAPTPRTAPAVLTAPAVAPAAWDLLSARQRDVARELAQGRTNKEIAGELGVSVRTVDMHVAHILERLDCRSRSEVAAKVTASLA